MASYSRMKEGNILENSLSKIFFRSSKIVTFDSLIDNLTTINKGLPQHNMTLKAVKKLLGARNLNTKNVLGEHAVLTLVLTSIFIF